MVVRGKYLSLLWKAWDENVLLVVITVRNALVPVLSSFNCIVNASVHLFILSNANNGAKPNFSASRPHCCTKCRYGQITINAFSPSCSDNLTAAASAVTVLPVPVAI